MQIHIIPSQQVNQIKWDACIAKSDNSLIYAHSFYLNAIADNWHGIVIDDYRAVVPLPWRKKYSIRYFYTPAFIQQSGLFGNWDEAEEKVVIQTMQSFALFGDYKFNFLNPFMDNVIEHNNLILHLSAIYNSIAENYKTDLLQNLKKAAKENLTYMADDDAAAAIKLYQQLYAARTPHVSRKDYQNFLSLCLALKKSAKCLIRKVTNRKGDILAVALLLKDECRLYNILNITTVAGRKTEANHFLIDRIINEFAGTNIVFDFEGSDILGVKRFYEKFGAISQPYFQWHYNRLPWPLRFLKK